eukprot:299082-Prorocentrum_minimum.AAC.1
MARGEGAYARSADQSRVNSVWFSRLPSVCSKGPVVGCERLLAACPPADVSAFWRHASPAAVYTQHPPCSCGCRVPKKPNGHVSDSPRVYAPSPHAIGAIR